MPVMTVALDRLAASFANGVFQLPIEFEERHTIPTFGPRACNRGCRITREQVRFRVLCVLSPLGKEQS